MHIYWLAGRWDANLVSSAEASADASLELAAIAYQELVAAERGERLGDLPEGNTGTSAQLVANTLLRRALRDVMTGDHRAASARLTEAVRVYHVASGLEDDFGAFWSLAVDISLRAQLPGTARELLSMVTDAPRGQITPLLRALSSYFRARLAAVDGSDESLIDADFAAGTVALRAFGAVFWLARCQLDHAEWLAGRGRGDEATAIVEEAERVFTSLRATPWTARAQQVRALALR